MNLKEFEEFKNENGLPPSRDLTNTLFNRVQSDLHPSLWRVFSKLSLIHLIVGAFTLSLCPQFGVRLFGHSMGLMEYFSSLGDYACMSACGFVFMSATILVATIFLSTEELRMLRRSQVFEVGALSILSLGIFLMLHAEILVGFAIAWVVGALIGSGAFIELGLLFKRQLRSI